MGYAVFSDLISYDVGLVFKNKREAIEWLKAKGIEPADVRGRYLMAPGDVHWL